MENEASSTSDGSQWELNMESDLILIRKAPHFYIASP